MDIYLDNISIRNFKGISKLDITMGDLTCIYGDNGTFKTTIFDAFLWCLFGKDSQNKKDFAIKPLEITGQEKHNLETSVDMKLIVDKKYISIKKIYQEKYTKKRGSAFAEFTGHTTDYFIDDIPLPMNEFSDRIKDIVGESIFRLLTDPRYFNEQLHWKERRNILVDICGEISQEDIINSDKSLYPLTALLDGQSMDDFKRKIEAQQKKINQELQKIPIRIDEQSRSIIDIRHDIDTIPGQIQALKDKKNHLEDTLTDIRNSGNASQKRIELQEIIAQILKRTNEYEQEKSAQLLPLKTKKTILENDKQENIRQKENAEARAEKNRKEIDILEKSMQRLRDQWYDVDKLIFSIDLTCPTCGQAIPADQIAQAKNEFLKSKSDRLMEITSSGKEKEKYILDLGEEIHNIAIDINSYNSRLAAINEDILLLKSNIDLIQNEKLDLSGLNEEKSSLEKEIADNSSNSESIMEINRQISDINLEIISLEKEIKKVRDNKAAQMRIDELSKQEKDLSIEFEKIEGYLNLINDFTRIKVGFLEDKINKNFEFTRFKLFEDQINGGLTEACETVLDGVPYSSVNNAGRIQIGLDVIKTLQKYYGIHGPVFIDNSESITSIPDMDCQIIKLIVSELDNQLRIEIKK